MHSLSNQHTALLYFAIVREGERGRGWERERQRVSIRHNGSLPERKGNAHQYSSQFTLHIL